MDCVEPQSYGTGKKCRLKQRVVEGAGDAVVGQVEKKSGFLNLIVIIGIIGSIPVAVGAFDSRLDIWNFFQIIKLGYVVTTVGADQANCCSITVV